MSATSTTTRNAAAKTSSVLANHRTTIGRMARFGLASRGVVYLVMGALAVQIAVGSTKQQASSQGALQEIATTRGGDVVLVLLALGFAAFALWRFSQAALGSAPEGNDAANRAKAVVRGIPYALLCSTAVSVLVGSAGSSQDQEQKSWTARLIRDTGGRVLVGIAALIVLGVGVYFVVRGVQKKFVDELDTASMSPPTRRLVVGLGGCGTVARGVVVGVVGILVLIAAITADPHKSQGLDGALRTMAHQPYGPWLLAVVALGLIAFGLFGLAESKYARV